MLEKPRNGWAGFRLGDDYCFGLSYLDDIAFFWLDAAIKGLRTNAPFTVMGHSEPGFMTCTVTDDHCYIKEECYPYVGETFIYVTKDLFCQILYEDISRNIDAWVEFYPQWLDDSHRAKRRRALIRRLKRLKKLLTEDSGDSDSIVSAT